MNDKIKKYLPYVFTLGGIIGIFASIVLTLEKIELLKNPSKQLGCDISPIIACGPVINTDQASAFGIPNPLLGIAGFGGMLAIGLVLFAGARFKKWFWQFTQLGLLAATVFVHWLFFQTLYRIESLCPYCMVVWVVTIIAFWYALAYNLREGNIKAPKKLTGTSKLIQKHHTDILLIWFLILIGLILNKFWYYWQTLI